MAESDVVSLHAHLSATRHMINAGTKLKDGATLIRRGSLIDEQALIRSCLLAAWACLDVTDPEPPAQTIRCMPNVVMTSHIAGR